MMRFSFYFAILLPLVIGCDTTSQRSKELPILGRKNIVKKTTPSGQQKQDTIYHTIPDFQFLDQDSNWVTPTTFNNAIYVTDFFFTSCPTICPVMTRQMKRVYDRFEDNPHVKILSHSIDPKHDSIPVLKSYAEKLGVTSDKWHFVRGPKSEVYDIAQSYLVSAAEDSSAPGGYVHSGAFLLVDEKGRLRGQYDGTDKKEVTQLMQDIEYLLDERFENS